MSDASGAVSDTARYARQIREAVGGGELALGLEAMVAARFGAGAIRTASMRDEVGIWPLHGQNIVWTSDELSPRRARWCVAHAFAAWLLKQDGVPHEHLRKLRAQLAAELLLPRDACPHLFPSADLPKLAEGLRLPLSFVLLREGEVFRRPTALVVPGRYTVVRGNDDGRLPTDGAALELLASRRGIGVQRWDVPEDRGVVIRVAA